MKEREIFLAALAIADPDKRDAFLASACSDAAQREHLRALLAAEPGLGTFLESPARPAASTGVDVGPGAVIGAYKLLEEIGEGAGLSHYAGQSGLARQGDFGDAGISDQTARGRADADPHQRSPLRVPSRSGLDRELLPRPP